MYSNSFKSMGVINLTPNSFSDGGLYTNTKLLITHFNNLKQWADIIDFGAESTAPFNDPITEQEELLRYSQSLSLLLASLPDPAIYISIDTYKIEIFKKIYEEVKSAWPKCRLIFNDVSGQVDDELLLLIQDKAYNFDYVLCHNPAPSREMTSSHMSFVNESKNIVKEVACFFSESLERLTDHRGSIYLDPCFGFGKTRVQNQKLLVGFNELANLFDDKFIWLIGISRKSFLRFPADMDLKVSENIETLEALQALILNDLLSKNKKKRFIFRTHNHVSIKAIRDYCLMKVNSK